MSNWTSAFASGFQQDELLHVPPSWLESDPDQDRTDLDTPAAQEELRELAEGMKRLGNDGEPYGVRRPIEVHRIDGQHNRFRIIAGERRWRASQIAELKTVPILVRLSGNPATWSLDMLTENINRRQLSLWDTARALQKRLDRGEFDSAQALATALGKSKAWVSKYTKVLKVSPEIQELARDRLINDVDNLRLLEKLPAERLTDVINRLREGDDFDSALHRTPAGPTGAQNDKGRARSEMKSGRPFVKLELSESEFNVLLTRLGLASPDDPLSPEAAKGLIKTVLRGN